VAGHSHDHLGAGRENLEDDQFIGAVGGFFQIQMFLGSAKGWAGAFYTMQKLKQP
jgi:hypothetical protein